MQQIAIAARHGAIEREKKPEDRKRYVAVGVSLSPRILSCLDKHVERQVRLGLTAGRSVIVRQALVEFLEKRGAKLT